MPKSKKAKTKHNSSKNSAELSQAEIWDDSALIRSWNDAVAEYEVCRDHLFFTRRSLQAAMA
jgi:hypothetical protein